MYVQVQLENTELGPRIRLIWLQRLHLPRRTRYLPSARLRECPSVYPLAPWAARSNLVSLMLTRIAPG